VVPDLEAEPQQKGVKVMNCVSRRTLQALMFACLLIGLTTCALAQNSSSSQPASDNSKVNARDRSNASPTADQQKHDNSDREITRQIRESVIKDKSLSTYAHNVKIISQNGMVTLRGPVRSAEEKQAIEAAATAVVGQEKVTDELEVTPKQ
jgi:osmotically-inducible protein OsmY